MKKLIYLVLTLITLGISSNNIDIPIQANAASYVYVTDSGKRYFYDKHDKGLKLGHAKRIIRMTESQAIYFGFTLSATEGGTQKPNNYIDRSYSYHIKHIRHHKY